MTGEGIRKKRDPIFSVCFVVFVVACVGVLGVYVDEHYIQSDDTVVFDTSLSSVDENDGYVKANEYSSSSFKTQDVTVGDGKFLAAFENALIGHKVGDTSSATRSETRSSSRSPSATDTSRPATPCTTASRPP